VASASCKLYDELNVAKEIDITHLIAIDELEIGKWANQIGTLKQARDSRWGYHFHSIYSLLKMFGTTFSMLEKVIKQRSTYSQREDANATYKMITPFQFIFILHLMNEIMDITGSLLYFMGNHFTFHFKFNYYHRLSIAKDW
jgi:hypothetical protein